MPQPDAYPTDDRDARSRFRDAVDRLGARRWSWEVGSEGEDLTIDAARLGPEDAAALLVVSGGVHGVEAAFGSAVQLAWLESGARSQPEGVAVLLLHVLNPFGFRHDRRFDAENIDLNRNFLLPGELYRGSPPLYARLDPLLNAPRPPRAIDRRLFAAHAAWIALRFGSEAVKQAVAGGQYDFPLGLFFGGHGPSATFRVLDTHFPALIGPARSVVHLDFHTGLGRRGAYTLLVDEPADAPSTRRLARLFGPDRIEPYAPGGTAYRARGTFGCWCPNRVRAPGRTYDYACAEFGTEPGPAVVAALRAENQAHHHLPPDHPARLLARARLREAFVPSDPSWRRPCLTAGLDLIGRAHLGLSSIRTADESNPW